MYEDTERPRTIISAFCVWQKLLETCKTQNESEQTTSEHIQAPAFQIYPPRSIPERSDNCQTTIIKPQGITAPLGTETPILQVYRKFNPWQKLLQDPW